MKKLIFMLAVLYSLTAVAQISTTPDGFAPGYFIDANNEKQEGFIKESFKKGSFLFIASNGTKKTYMPADINEFAIGVTVYTSCMNDFYKVMATGNKGSLLQKVTNNSGKILYNSNEAYVATTTEGKPGNYYLHIKATSQINLVTKDNFEKVFAASCGDCVALQTNIKEKQLDFMSIEKAVILFNNCK